MDAKKNILLLLGLAVAGLLFAYLFRDRLMIVEHHPPGQECGVNLRGLAKAIKVYAYEHNDKYPPPDKWCDSLLQLDYVTEKEFICKSATMRGDQGRSYYAMNLNCEPNSPQDMVLLFETKGGWNQFGGPELLTFENHNGLGCNVAFNNGRVEFIKPKDVGKLKWEGEKNK